MGGGEAYWLSVNIELFLSNLPISTGWSLEIYYRLLLADILPEEIERILYLDVDIIINHSLENLFFTEEMSAIIHFVGRKPWEGQYMHFDIEQLWWDYAKLTPFYHEFMEEYIFSAVHDPVLYEEKRRINEELASMKRVCGKILSMVQK